VTGHSHQQNARRVLWALSLTGSFMVVEVIGGLISGSLALLADAGHMLTDTLALTLTWAAFRIADRPANTRHSYGYYRFQVLAAFVNGLTLIGIVGWILFEAVQRLMEPGEVMGQTMLIVAVAGLLVNIVAFLILHLGDRENLNIQGAALHVLGDLLGSVGAIAAAIVILTTGWMPIDPILSVVVAMLIFRSAWALVKKSAHILLEGTPDWLDIDEMRDKIHAQVDTVTDIHHVHVWNLTQDRLLLTMHATLQRDTDPTQTLRAMKDLLRTEYGITHATIETEWER
jgi:cobalt-zinc-cadmium efflux system protein